MPPPTAGRLLILIPSLVYATGAFYFDWTPTHVLNPRWPPHARFHNGQTMSLGLLLCAFVGYCLFLRADGRGRGRGHVDVDRALDHVFTAAVVGSFYCVAGVSAILYPGSDWNDPEFEEENGATRGWQGYLFSGLVVVTWVGYLVERRRLLSLSGPPLARTEGKGTERVKAM